MQTDSYEVGATKGFELGKVHLDVRVLGRHTEQLNQSTFVNATGGIDIYTDATGAVIGRDSRTIDYDKVVGGKIAGIYRAIALQLTGNQVYTDYNTLATDFGFTFKLGQVENKLLVFGTYDEFSRDTMPRHRRQRLPGAHAVQACQARRRDREQRAPHLDLPDVPRGPRRHHAAGDHRQLRHQVRLAPHAAGHRAVFLMAPSSAPGSGTTASSA
ncbi:MAG: hypothetical protein WDM96_11415 [Lacunisphaera sp.]